MKPFQEKVPHHPKILAQKSWLVTKEVESMLKKGTIQKASVEKGQFLSNLFLVAKKDGGTDPCNKLKKSESIHSLSSLQNGRLAFAEGNAERERLHVQDRHEGCLVLCSTASKILEVHPVLLERSVTQIPVSIFWPGTGSTIFTKLLKIPIAILRRINIRITVYLDDMLLMSQILN